MSEEQQEIRKFVRGGNKKYSLKEKHELGKLIEAKMANLKTEVTRIQSTPNFQGVKNVRFSENLAACFVFLLPPF